MVVNVRDFLPIAVVYEQPVMAGDAEFFGHQLGSFIEQSQDFGRGVLEVRVFGFGQNEQVNSVFWAVIGDDDDSVGLVEDTGGQFTVNDACKY